jgi:hypothetical protein
MDIVTKTGAPLDRSAPDDHRPFACRCGTPSQRFHHLAREPVAGFEQVFAHAVEVHLPGGMTVRVAPPIITALLKIIAWVDNPYQRAKDLQDIRIVLCRYEQERDRLFSDAVFDAELPDFEFSNAFLLGLDMRALATGDDARFVEQFLERLLVQGEEGRFDDELDFGMKSFRGQIVKNAERLAMIEATNTLGVVVPNLCNAVERGRS